MIKRRRFIAKVDVTHKEVVRSLRACGCLVLSLAELGRGAPDLLVYCPRNGGRLVLLEVKNPDGAGTDLTEAEAAFQEAGWPVRVVTSGQEAVDVVLR